MSSDEFLRLLEDAFELSAGTLQGTEMLEDLESWDSLTMMSYIALADEHYGVTISPRQIVNCKTVNDLVSLAANSATEK